MGILKGNGVEILITDNPGTPFERGKGSSAHVPASTADEETFYQKDFSLGGFDAHIKYGKPKQLAEEKILMLFGNQAFTTLALCTIPADKLKTRQQVLAALMTLVVDTSLHPDYASFNNFTVDESRSVFKFNSNASTFSCYTVGGKGNVEDNYVTVARLPAFSKSEDLRDCCRSLAGRTKSSMNVSSVTEGAIKINGQPAYETTLTGSVNGISKKCYFLVVGNARSSVYLIGVTNQDKPFLFKECIALAQTLRLK